MAKLEKVQTPNMGTITIDLATLKEVFKELIEQTILVVSVHLLLFHP